MDEFDLDLEQDKKQPVQIVKKGGWLGKIISLFLGIIIGFVGCFGAIAAVVYYFIGVMKIEEGAGYLKSILGDDFEYTDYIAEDYGDKTALDLLTSTVTAAQTLINGTGTLNTLNEIYPFIYTLMAGEEESDENAMFNGLVPLLQQYGLDLDADVMMDLIVTGSGDAVLNPDVYLGDYVLDKVYDLSVGGLLQNTGMVGSPIIDALFFGEKDVDYFINENGLKEPLEGGTPWLTLEDLLFSQSDVIGERVNSLTLDSVTTIAHDNDIMMTLAYGPSSQYTIENGEVLMKQQTYTFDGVSFYDIAGEKVDVTDAGNGVFSLTQGGKTLYLKADSATGNYLAYTDAACTKAALYRKTTVGDLSGDTTQLVNRIELGKTLHLTPSSNKVLLALAYGTQDEDYEVVNGEIKMKDGKKARTLGDLTNGGDQLIENILLADVMEAETDDAIMMYLLYGKKDVHYALDANKKPDSLQKQIAVLDYNSTKTPYNEYGDVPLDGTTDGTTYTVSGVTYYLSPVSAKVNITVKNASNEEVKVESDLYYVFEDEEKTKPVMFEPTSLGTLLNDKSIISNLTGRLTLAEVMGADTLRDTPMESLGGCIISDVPNQIESLTIGEVVEDANSNRVLKHLTDVTIKDLPSQVESLTIGQILEDDIYNPDGTQKEGANPVLWHLRTTSITDLSEDVNDMTVGNIFGDEIYAKDEDGNWLLDETTPNPNDYLISSTANHVLAALHDKKVCELSSAMNELYVGDMFVHEIYMESDDGVHFKPGSDARTGYEVDPDANPILVHLRDVYINDMGNEVENLTVGEVFEDEIYDEDGNVKGTWYYLLKDPATGETNVNYKLTSDMNTMVDNMSENIENASLKELNEKGIIDLSDNALLSDTKNIPYEFLGIPEDQRYKDKNGEEKELFNQLTVYELFDFVGKIIPTTP